MLQEIIESSGRTRWLTALVACVALLAPSASGCGDNVPPAPDTIAPFDGEAIDSRPDIDEGITCCPTGTCPFGQDCFNGACLPRLAAQTCYFDGQCPSGAVCEASAICACGQTGCTPEAGTCYYPEGCCNSESDCGGGAVCASGRCLNLAVLGDACWTDGQCSGGLKCEGANICPCGSTNCEDAPGICAQPGVCCATDAECGTDGTCHDGRCVPKAGDGSCWDNDDCGNGDTCLGAASCACVPGAAEEWNCNLPSTAGRCGKAADACCANDSDCGNAQICLEGRACVAAPKPAADDCWVDAHCGSGRECVGASVCGCSEDGCTDSTPGLCRTKVIACSENGDCPTAMKCSIPDTAWCPGSAAPEAGVCVPLNDSGCWNSSECNGSTRCAAEVVCNRANGCNAPNRPGICDQMVRKWDCCNSHLECGPGLECRNQNSSQTCPPNESAVCVPIPIQGETCWNLNDCPQGLACQKAIICGCNGRCIFSRIGQCERPTNCQANIDCGTDGVCARDAECILSPCSSVSTCPFGGTCQDKEEGLCWNHESCPSGQYCENLRVCPPDTTCAYPNSPGVCQPRVGLGDCCTSYRGCEPGLRCISAGMGSGCALDSTSVCVPGTAVTGTCYSDEDCDRTEFCEGENVCPCGLEDCDGEPRPGRCSPR